jgi:hypothetical protein
VLCFVNLGVYRPFSPIWDRHGLPRKSTGLRSPLDLLVELDLVHPKIVGKKVENSRKKIFSPNIHISILICKCGLHITRGQIAVENRRNPSHSVPSLEQRVEQRVECSFEQFQRTTAGTWRIYFNSPHTKTVISQRVHIVRGCITTEIAANC